MKYYGLIKLCFRTQAYFLFLRTKMVIPNKFVGLLLPKTLPKPEFLNLFIAFI